MRLWLGWRCFRERPQRRSFNGPETRLRECSAMTEGWHDSGMTGPSEREAFEAVTLFLSQYYERAGDDMATLMADITIRERWRHARPSGLGRLAPVRA